MERRLLRMENLALVECLLDDASCRLDELHELKNNGALSFGPKINPNELSDLVTSVCVEVDSFLDIQSKTILPFGYFSLFNLGVIETTLLALYSLATLPVARCLTSPPLSLEFIPTTLFNVGEAILPFIPAAMSLHSMARSPGYDPIAKKIILGKELLINLKPSVAHEYTHYLQEVYGICSKKCDIFMEGHARGVQKYVAELFAENERNLAYKYDIMDTTVGEFKSTYLWMCKKLQKVPRESLLITPSQRDFSEGWSRFFRKPSSHALGNTLLSIYESQLGSRIYSDMIHGNFKWD